MELDEHGDLMMGEEEVQAELAAMNIRQQQAGQQHHPAHQAAVAPENIQPLLPAIQQALMPGLQQMMQAILQQLQQHQQQQETVRHGPAMAPARQQQQQQQQQQEAAGHGPIQQPGADGAPPEAPAQLPLDPAANAENGTPEEGKGKKFPSRRGKRGGKNKRMNPYERAIRDYALFKLREVFKESKAMREDQQRKKYK